MLVEESCWPLTTASWSPRGRTVAFGRFVPQSIEPDQAVERGRFEVVLQNGLERKEVVWTSSSFELDARDASVVPAPCLLLEPRRFLPGDPRSGTHACDSDRQRECEEPTASPGPCHSSGVVSRRLEARVHPLRKRLPESRGHRTAGSKLRFCPPGRRAQGGHDPPPQAIGPVTARPFWSNDGRSILAVVERATSRSPELELARCVVNTTEVIRLLSLVPEPVRRTAVVRGVAIDFDREAERCFFSVELDGRDSDVAWSVPRNHETHKRFNPVDISQRVEALAVSPDGRLLAVRFGTPGGLSPPAVYDTETEQTTLLVPDGTARSQWLSVLAGTAERLLLAGLPPAVADGRAAQRPTLLPLPGEIAAHDMVSPRLIRIAKFGSSVCSSPGGGPDAAGHRAGDSSDVEARLFFNYLLGDFPAAADDLETLDSHISDLDHRLSLLSLRAQILWWKGQKDEAREVIGYLVSNAGAHTLRIEETPLGPVVTTDVSPGQSWARYLAMRADTKPELQAQSGRDPAGEFAGLNPPDPFDLLEIPGIERGGARFPLGPAVPGQAGEPAAPPNGPAIGPGRPFDPRF